MEAFLQLMLYIHGRASNQSCRLEKESFQPWERSGGIAAISVSSAQDLDLPIQAAQNFMSRGGYNHVVFDPYPTFIR